MSEMKTVKEWLNELPEPLNRLALERAGRSAHNRNRSSLCSALMYGFTWCCTDENHNFWFKVHQGKYTEAIEYAKGYYADVLPDHQPLMLDALKSIDLTNLDFRSYHKVTFALESARRGEKK